MEKIYKISIIVPIYNVEKYIKRCLDSLINQTYKNLEIILIDDGSIDRSGKICDEYQINDSRCKVVHKNNEGQSIARNVGLEKATGNFIMFVDADDWLDLDCIDLCMKNIINDNNIDCVIFPYIREFRDVSKVNNTLGNKEKLFTKTNFKLFYRRFFGLVDKEKSKPDKLNDLNAPWGKLFKIDYVKNVKFKHRDILGYSEDGYFNVELFINFNKVLYIPYVHYHYNKENMESTLHQYNKNLFKTRNNFHDLLYKFIEKYNLDDDYKIAVDNRVVFDLLDLNRNIINSNLELKNKYRLVDKLLNEKRIRKAFYNFDFKYLDLKWKIYYFLCKNNIVIGVIGMTLLAEKLKKYLR